ncbi:MAG: IS256 family transposase [Candidatus Latescibacteria bacterium]|nr:IS256 family transposase [Candidatus Latescibacterota bacterium]
MALLDELIKDCKTPEDLLGKHGLLKELSKGLVERMLQGELTHHLGYEKHALEGRKGGSSRNGSTAKNVQTGQGELALQVPRDREGSFEPQIVPKGERRLAGFDEKIISLYARGRSVAEIQGHLEELYGAEVSPGLISDVTDSVLAEVKAWQCRPVAAVYPILYLDALMVKVRDNGVIHTKAVYLALGVNLDGDKELLGLWLSPHEGAKFWLQILTELKNRGLREVLIVCVDGLSGFPEALEAVFPHAQVQLCIVHLVRQSLRYVTHKDRKQVATDLKKIYQATTSEEAQLHLEVFTSTWDAKYASISRLWRGQWDHWTTFFAYPPEIRKVIYTTNAIESLNHSLGKILKIRGAFPTDDAVTKLIYLAMRNIAKKWTRPLKDWKAALNQFSLMFPESCTLP